MNNLKTFNELYRSTYFKYGNRMKYKNKQKNRGDALIKHGNEHGLYKNFFLKDYQFDVYVNFTTDSEGEEIYPKKVFTNLKIQDYFENEEDEYGSFQFDTPNYLNISICLAGDKVKITLFDDDNKFANRKSAVKFIDLMHKFYIFHDPNTNRNAMAKINKTKLSQLTHEDVEDSNGNFWAFLQRNGYDWEKFRSQINLHSLWDDLMPDPPQWTSNRT
tara:strand:- start:72293 stop:72943 length:651 start_codon:yes stop_codon:yes gene_type:complete